VKSPWFNLWFSEGIIKPQMQSGNTIQPLKSSPFRRFAKALAEKFKIQIFAEAVQDGFDGAVLYADIIQKSSQPLLVANPDATIISCNEAYLKIMGYTKEEFEKIECAIDFTPPEWQEITRDSMEELHRTGRPVRYEKEYIRKDSKRFPVEIFLHFMKDENGLLYCYYAFTTDITQRKLAEAAMIQAKLRYRNLFEEAPVMYVITRNQGGVPVIVDCNALFLSTMGYTISEVMEHPLGDFYTPESCAEMLEGGGYQRALSNRFTSEERKLLTRDGKIKETLMRAVPESDADGNVTGTRAMFIDVTAQKQAERQLLALSLRQEAILSAIPDIVIEVDVDKVYTWANEAAKEFFGPDVIGKEASFYYADEQDTYNLVKPLLSGIEDSIYLESLQIRKDGEKRLLAWWCRALKDEHGNVRGALSTARDITEQRQAKIQLGSKIEELQRWNKAVMGREMRVIELKREVNELLVKSGQPKRYNDNEQ